MEKQRNNRKQKLVSTTIMSRSLTTHWNIACLSKHPHYLNGTIKGVTFVFHFLVVMTILFLGAIVLVLLEDPDVFHKDNNSTFVNKSRIYNRSAEHAEAPSIDLAAFWRSVQKKYNFTLDEKFHDDLWSDIDSHMEELKLTSDHHHTDTIRYKVKRDRKFIIMKWFYFVVVASTTIGYGHVYPKTDEGKLFYIFFSIVGIVLMMTLLRSCGKILMVVNKKVYTVIRRIIFNNRKYASDELMSVVTISVMFLVFMVSVVLHDKSINEVKDWSMVDTFYFWLVTFTTVGFGDMHFPLKVEVEHFTELLLYRLSGLSFLAAIIESIQAYIKYRRLILIEKSKPRLRKVAQVMIGSRFQQSSNVDKIIGEIV